MFLLSLLLSIIGFCITLYDYYIEYSLKKNPLYKPVCDITDSISCTKPIQSAYGKLFGISNSLLGMGFYVLMIILSLIQAELFLFIFSFIAVLFSIYLAYILMFKIRSLCFICVAIYSINVALLLVSYYYYYYI